ncbi:hypothetical protein [Alistipes sp.]|jgi:hypothetical protein|uniref:hypothetical protein n=1 Tax=Alistipes sp. TaxID=1872444 RepID=UPI00204F4653|nr:MAG TPA: hypothetical protein [Bacteriophage sp.]
MVVTQFTSKQRLASHGENVSSESLTQPDMSYDIRTILAKFTVGIDPAVSKIPNYDDEPSFDSIDPSRTPGFDVFDAYSELEQVTARQRILKQKGLDEEKRKASQSIPGQVSSSNSDADPSSEGRKPEALA